MHVWRICRLSDVDKLSGVGGLYVGGRWHGRGNRILYTSSTPSLAALELLVHLDPASAPANLSLLEIDIPDKIRIEHCIPSQITPNWQNFPFPLELQNFGSTWLVEKRTAILSVPSAIIPRENNILINPVHFDASLITIKDEIPFAYDPRLQHH